MLVSRLSKKNFSNPVCILRFTSTSSFSQQNKLLVSQRGFKQIIVTVSHNVMKEHTSSLVFRNHFSSSKQAGFQHSAGSYSASDRNKPCKQMSAHTHMFIISTQLWKGHAFEPLWVQSLQPLSGCMQVSIK